MAASSHCASVPSLPPPSPKSPPQYPDLYGKRRELAKVQILEREIGALEEELKSLEGLQLASRCCKEVDDYIVSKPDPFIPTNRKIRRSYRLWRWLCGKSCFNWSWTCCCCSCSLHLKKPSCCPSQKYCCASFFPESWRCGCRPNCHCWGKMPCIQCCIFPAPSCPDCPSCRCTCSFPKCNKICLCSNCTKNCCNPCYICC